MLISEVINKLEAIKSSHGDQPCWLEYDGSIITLECVEMLSMRADRDVYIQKPKDSIYKGVFFLDYLNGNCIEVNDAE